MRNITKQVAALAMSLVFSTAAFAQLTLGTVTGVREPSPILRGEAGIDYAKYATGFDGAKTAGVNISVLGTEALTATFHYDKNDATVAYYVLYGVPGLVEFYVEEYGYSHYQLFNGFYQQGMVSLFTTDTTETIGGVFPGDSIVAYTLALASADDTVGILSYQGVVIRPLAGDAGRAEVLLAISNVTDSSCDITTEMNASASCYFFAYGSASNYTGVPQDEIIYSIRTYLEATTENIDATLPNLMRDTTYTVFIVPYNAIGELGEYVARNFTPGAQSVFTANGVNFSLYPNPATAILNVEGDEVERVELFNAMGQRVSAVEHNGTALQINASSLAKGAYILKVYGNGKVGTQKVIVK